MKFFLLLYICFLAGISLAAVENINLAREEVTCGPVRYTKRDIELAVNSAREHHNNGTTVGDPRSYPHGFGNFDNVVLADNCDNDFLAEFPLTRTIAYRGGDPGAQRVAVNYINNTDVRLCAVMFHRQRDRRFVGCDWSAHLLSSSEDSHWVRFGVWKDNTAKLCNYILGHVFESLSPKWQGRDYEE